MDRSEGEAGCAACQERGRGRRLLLGVAIEAGLLAFLGENGAEEGDQAGLIAGVGGEQGLRYGERAENDVGEGLSEGYGLREV